MVRCASQMLGEQFIVYSRRQKSTAITDNYALLHSWVFRPVLVPFNWVLSL